MSRTEAPVKPRKTLMQWLALIAALGTIVTSLVFAATLKRTEAEVPGWIFYWLYGFGAGVWFAFLIRQWMRRH